jgi:hypothetical protein
VHACHGQFISYQMLASDALAIRPAAPVAASRLHRGTIRCAVVSKQPRKLAVSWRRQCVRVCATSSLAAGASRGTSVAVIGGGVGGLVVAGLLARQGLQVTLLEQNTQVS